MIALSPIAIEVVRRIDAQSTRGARYLGDAENKGEDIETRRNWPEDIEIRVRGQIREAGEMLPQQAAEGRWLHTGPCAQGKK